MNTNLDYPKSQPPQTQDRQPGLESEMRPAPLSIRPDYRGSGKLAGKVGLVTGGDSGIGKAVALHFAAEGAHVVVVYLNEDGDARQAESEITQLGVRCLTIRGDIGDEQFCKSAVDLAIGTFGRLDVLVNNAAEQHPQKSIEDISTEQLEQTFRTNVFSFFYLVKASLPHLKEGATIINTTSVTAYHGSPELLDYSSTKGAIVAFTRSLSQSLVKKKIRVNAVAPGPIWTPLIPSTFDAKDVASFGSDTPMERAGQPAEVAPAYVFLACEDSSYMSGQVMHPNGGEIVNG